MDLLAGLDIGTSSCKLCVIDLNGKVQRIVSASYPMSEPHPGWAEQNPGDWLMGARACLAQIDDLPIAALGITGQMHGAAFLSEALEPVHSAMLWCDVRTGAECREIESAVGSERYRRIAKNVAMPGFQLPKLLWLRRHSPDSWVKVRRILLPKDYVAAHLTGQIGTDAADASGTGAFDVASRAWSEEILGAVGLPMEIFPRIVAEGEPLGTTFVGSRQVPVFLAGGDQSANGIGTGAARPEIASLALGSSGVVFTSTDSLEDMPNDTLNRFCHLGGRFLKMGVTLNCGLALNWGREQIAPSMSASEFDALALQGLQTENPPFFAPWVSGERCPVSLEEPRFGFTGVSGTSSISERAYAIYDGVAQNLKWIADLMSADLDKVKEVRLSGGGARSSWWPQYLADVLHRPVALMETEEGPAFGAALVAGVGVGRFANFSEAAQETVRTSKVIDPAQDRSARYAHWRAAVQDAEL